MSTFTFSIQSNSQIEKRIFDERRSLQVDIFNAVTHTLLYLKHYFLFLQHLYWVLKRRLYSCCCYISCSCSCITACTHSYILQPWVFFGKYISKKVERHVDASKIFTLWLEYIVILSDIELDNRMSFYSNSFSLFKSVVNVQKLLYKK